jgi:sugar phosphate isomerase/epimerase
MKRFSTKITRRSMLACCGRTAGFALAASSFAPLFAAPQSRWFKIGALDASLGKRCDLAAFDVAKEVGLDGVQVDMGNIANDMRLRRPDVQKAYIEAARQTGVELASLGIAEMWVAPLKSDPRAARWLSDSIDICNAFGMRVVLIPCFDLDPSKPAGFDAFVEVVKRHVSKAEKQGVILGLENWLSAEDNMRIIERVGSPSVMVYYDVGNSTDKGRDVCKEIRTLGKLICELHAKDGRYMLGQGRIDFRQVRKALDDIGYSGWIQIEAAAPHGVVVDYTADRKYLKGIFPSRLD